MEFKEFPKIARLSRDIVVTEKIDGTNSSIYIGEDGELLAGSRTRWITPENDNYGFAQWVLENNEELLTLGPGHHFGEWWGRSINRNYGLKERKFSLFNTRRWCLHGQEPRGYPTQDPRIFKLQQVLPQCCELVPVLYEGPFDTAAIEDRISRLREFGSVAAPGYMRPEGVVVFHTAANICFKKTLEKDEQPKGKAHASN
mgnify:FL=1